jgi:2-polyprenyl-3-methyl-5-hydroxy-6-metoxy-1,4-benzoquinol methylase
MTEKRITSGIPCHSCGTKAVELVPGYEMRFRVTSDSKPWPKGGQLGACRACGFIQKVIDTKWHTEVEQIYTAYSIYHQGNGAEQVVFEQSSGQASLRSARLLERLKSYAPLPETGRLLDIGCGNGSLLRTFTHTTPNWSLVGTELNEKYRTEVESIERVEGLYTCSPEQVPGIFDLITMVHVLEHILQPANFLTSLWNKLKENGYLVIEVPNHGQNPFDLLIVDHCTHFTIDTLTALVESAGYQVVFATSDWVPKELTLIARKADTLAKSLETSTTDNGFISASHSLKWLSDIVTEARKFSDVGHFGLFGTSIAATWLYSELENESKGTVQFFVDEDLNRAGKTYLGCPVFHPQQAPDGSHIFLALPPNLAEAIANRVAKPGVQYHLLSLLFAEG